MGRSSVDPIVYLDYNATTPIRPEALDAMTRALATVGNASSAHSPGQQASRAVEQARAHLAALLDCSPTELTFTSGATEANNLAIRSAVEPGRAIVISTVEHTAVTEAAEAVAAACASTVYTVRVHHDGTLRLDDLEAALAERPALVSIMAANNETGVVNDLSVVVKLAHDAGSLVHTDATQLVGRLPIDVRELDIDLLSLSAHKFGGPQGVGALFVRRGALVAIQPLAFGGGHERGRRPGTLNVAGIVGLGAAAAAAASRLDQEVAEIRALRDRLEAGVLAELPDTRLNGRLDSRLPGVSSMTFSGLPADAVLAAMPAVAASEGSACAAGALEPSRVLLAMGLTRDEAECTVRFSLGYATTTDDIDRAVGYITEAVRHVRATIGDPTVEATPSTAGPEE
ncbi:cysteine desulfurase family protein [Dactylosporangium sp. NPDC005572]|uniref:cysteine desulfurase family protein n=1 Tax=Dactylosporangium sp. NPDC005572 TaxID=3156889 RepID=UPI0033A5B7DD